MLFETAGLERQRRELLGGGGGGSGGILSRKMFEIGSSAVGEADSTDFDLDREIYKECLTLQAKYDSHDRHSIGTLVLLRLWDHFSMTRK